MSTESSGKKPLPDLQKWLAIQIVANAVSMIVVTAISIWLVYYAFGSGEAVNYSPLIFVLIFVPFFTLVQPMSAIVNTRRDFLHGRLEMPGEPGDAAGLVANPWRRLALRGISAGIIATGLLGILVFLLGHAEVSSPPLIGTVCLGVTLVTTTLLIYYLVPRDMTPLASAVSAREKSAPESPAGYFLIEHALPWMVLQGGLNFALAFPIFGKASLETKGLVHGSVIAIDGAIMTLIIMFFVWLSSQAQVRTDLHLGRAAKNSSLSLPGLLLRFAAVAVGTGVVVKIALGLVGLDPMAIIPAAFVRAGIAAAAGFFGAWLGMAWGKSREPLVEAQANTTGEE